MKQGDVAGIATLAKIEQSTGVSIVKVIALFVFVGVRSQAIEGKTTVTGFIQYI